MGKKQGQPDVILFLTTLMLLTIGTIMVLSASSYQAMLFYDDAYHFFKRQIMWAVLGLIAMFIMMNVDYRILKNLVKPGYWTVVGLLVLVLLIGKDVNGSTRWIALGSVNFGPAELAKLIIVYTYAKLLSDYPQLLKNLAGFFMTFVPLGIVVLLIMLQPDLGTTMSICATVVCIMLVAGAQWKHFILLAIPGVILFIYAIVSSPYRAERILGYLRPFENAGDAGYQLVQSLYALGSGWIFGVGLGNSRQKFLYLPERHTDFIFAIIGEELGFIGAMLVILLFGLFTWRGFWIAMNAPDRFAALVAIGLTSMVTIQAAINIGVVVGAFPVTGITLPFISYGGTSLLFMMAGVGALLNISRHVQVGKPLNKKASVERGAHR